MRDGLLRFARNDGEGCLKIESEKLAGSDEIRTGLRLPHAVLYHRHFQALFVDAFSSREPALQFAREHQAIDQSSFAAIDSIKDTS